MVWVRIRHIVNNKYINEQEVQCKLTALCLRYLSLPCFVSGYDDCQRRENARQGWFSFQDYACSNWHHHMETLIRKCNSLRVTQYLIEFADALELFIQTHRHDLTKGIHSELEWDLVERFQNNYFYDDLLLLWNHIFTHQKGSFEARNEVGIAQIGKALDDNRAVLEINFVPSDRAENEDSIGDYYGPNLFKCKRTLCRFFHIGYDNKKARENHDNRHDRPYPCPIGCNIAPIGFAILKDKDRHIRIYHPELTDRPSMFETPNRGDENGRFSCLLCSKKFTRRENLRSHERSHFGMRPYKCSVCEKAFARLHECKRHEKNKSCKTVPLGRGG